MRDLIVELKALRLHGMAGAWSDLVEQGTNAGVDSSRWLLEHLLAAEGTDRAMRSVSHQMHSAKFPMHRDLAGFDFEASPVDRKLVHQLADLSFTEAAHNAVLVGGPGTGKTHLATAIGVSGITRHGMRVRFYYTVDPARATRRSRSRSERRVRGKPLRATPCASSPARSRHRQGGRRPGKHLHLCTADHQNVGFQPRLKIRSAGWLRIGSARTAVFAAMSSAVHSIR
jgi:hypothetical protein